VLGGGAVKPPQPLNRISGSAFILKPYHGIDFVLLKYKCQVTVLQWEKYQVQPTFLYLVNLQLLNHYISKITK
jgi:hypothetical protein